MAEQIYNVFLFFDAKDLCSVAGYATHLHEGSDQERIDFLRQRVDADLALAQKVPLSRPFTRSEYNARCRIGEGHHLYDELFVQTGAGAAPLFVSTPVLDGKTHFNYSSEHGDLDVNEASEKLGEPGVMVDWLRKYASDDGINFSQLIHDDYFLAIKLTFNAGLYVSAMKLLVCCIDSLAYIEYGDDRGAFVKWMEAYCDLAPLGITAAELWGLRNGILHMTNLNSSSVLKGQVRRISFRVGDSPEIPRDVGGVYYFDFLGLVHAFAQAQARWIESYNDDRGKFAKFVERYDETISDSRVAVAHLGDGGFATAP
ncbi:hypothetical protein [Aerolutibacter ruishenii]|uniref:Uncharacterized protein n=1 Tax=Aerolutibacter ruishenii TaxID=686800 RepID=A0A562LSG5_9GAMM|nr:hypothetical protein [Lysobacter ruishenii]TWI10513.1 hypothetical protein IP93_01601 [Lysobacter ruishenii]